MVSFSAPRFAEAADVPGDPQLQSFTSTADLRASEFGSAAMIGTPDQLTAKIENYLANHHCTDFTMQTQVL